MPIHAKTYLFQKLLAVIGALAWVTSFHSPLCHLLCRCHLEILVCYLFLCIIRIYLNQVMRFTGFLAHHCFMYLLLSLDLKKCMGVHSLVIISERLKYSSDNVIFLFGFSLDCRISVQIFPLEYFWKYCYIAYFYLLLLFICRKSVFSLWKLKGFSLCS